MNIMILAMAWDGSMELEMAGIGPAVAELKYSQKLGCPMAMPERAR